MADSSLYDRLEISLPGAWVDHTDRDHAWTVYGLLSDAAGQFNDAVVACQFFEPITAGDLKRDASGELLSRHHPVRDRLRGIYARAYVYALDTTCSFVKILVEQSLNAPPATAACNAFLRCFQDVRHIRNSLAHVDERSQSIGSGRKKLPGPLLIISGAFIDNRFGVTSGDGLYAEVEISEQLLACLRSALLEIIWSFEWIVIGNIRAQRPEHTA
jgi:hypothetical protein